MMSTTKNLRLGRIVKILLDILLGLSVFVCVGLILWVAVVPLVLNQSEGWGTASVPVRIGTGQEPQFDVSFSGLPEGDINAAFVSEAEGTLFLETRDFLLILIANAAKIVGLIGLTYIVYLLRNVVKSILEGEPFAEESSRSIRKMGYTLLAVSIVWQAVQYLAASEILKRLTDIQPELHPGPTFEAGVILVSLLILLLSQVWSYGLDIERERALTI
jgi:hypothetical protein